MEEVKTLVSNPMSQAERKDLYMILYKQGKTDKEISEAGGVSMQAIWQWRKNNKLSDNKYPKKQNKLLASKKKEVPEAIKPQLKTCEEVLKEMDEIDRPEAVDVPSPDHYFSDKTYPVIELRSNYVWKQARLSEILEAAVHCIAVEKDIPYEWIQEYIEILIDLDKLETS